jgi:hypothetical protein
MDSHHFVRWLLPYTIHGRSGGAHDGVSGASEDRLEQYQPGENYGYILTSASRLELFELDQRN